MKRLVILLLFAARLGAADAVTETAAADAGELGGLKSRLESLELGVKSESSRLHIEGYTQLRYDDQQYKISGIYPPNSGQDIVGTAGSVTNNVRGGYIKKFEFKFSGEVVKDLKWSAGYDFAEGKLKDLGTEWSGLPLIPFAFPDYTWTMKVGQFRQPFGAEPQTGQPNVAFHERSLINGGASPLNVTFTPDLKLIGERVLGLHFYHKHSYGVYGYEWGMALSNDGNDQVKGSNSLSGAFPAQLTDENPTFTARYGLTCDAGGKHRIGVSYQHNPKDSAFMATATAQSVIDESLGLDWHSEFGKLAFIQAEWIGQNSGISGASGLKSRREGWYAEAGFNALKLIAPSAPDKVELLGRYEQVNFDVHNRVYSPNVDAVTAGLKWTYGKNSQTSVNYTAYGIDNNFGAAGNVNLLTFQDLITY